MKKSLLMTLAGVGLAVAGVAMSKKDNADSYDVETVEGEVIDETGSEEESVVEE